MVLFMDDDPVLQSIDFSHQLDAVLVVALPIECKLQVIDGDAFLQRGDALHAARRLPFCVDVLMGLHCTVSKKECD